MIYCEYFRHLSWCAIQGKFYLPSFDKRTKYSNVKALDLYMCSVLLIFEMMKEKLTKD